MFFYFGSGGAGGVKANVDRWMKQFEDPQGQSVKTETIGGIKVTFAQAHGTFLSGRPFGPKTPKPGFAMLAAIIEGKKRCDLRKDDRSQRDRGSSFREAQKDGCRFVGKVAFESGFTKLLTKPSATARAYSSISGIFDALELASPLVIYPQ